MSDETESQRVKHQWIDADDFYIEKDQDVPSLKEKYECRTSLSQLLNVTTVELEKAEETNGWSSRKKRAVMEWKNELEYQYTVNWFFLYELKKMEGYWSWIVIVVSTMTSTLSLVDLDPYFENEYWIKGSTSIFSIGTTLVASWLKKENYVDRIKNIDRYIQKLSKLNTCITSILAKTPWDRISYDGFLELYEPQIVQLLSEAPPMSPEEYKAAVWKLTKYYPEIVKNKYPWYKRLDNGNYVVTDWGLDVLRTYDAVHYNTCFRKIMGCYFCKCKCCKKTESISEIYKHPETTVTRSSLSIWPNPPPSNTHIMTKITGKLNINRDKQARRKSPILFIPSYDVKNDIELTKQTLDSVDSSVSDPKIPSADQIIDNTV